MSVTFYLPKPKSAPRGLEWPAKKPDLSKLIRGVEDALTAIVYVDDSRIVVSHIEKRFAIDSPPRVEIEVLSIAEFWNVGWKTA
jgi:Holliday junction resolvase RusA-like endonuclease